MCGLVGVINKRTGGFWKQQMDVFASLLYLSGGYRGRDGTGVVVVDNLGNVQLAKSQQTVPDFLATQEFDELTRRAFRNGSIIFGHNRAATRGVVNDANAHPFIVDDKIVLVHNGTFNEDHKDLKVTDVDSEVIAHMLSENDDPEVALRKVNAAYALMWYNVDTKKFTVVRNAMRPLFIANFENMIVYASEQCFIEFAMMKHSLKLVGESKVMEITPYKAAVFTITDEKKVTFETMEMDCSYDKHNPTGSGRRTGPFQSYSTGRKWNYETSEWEEIEPKYSSGTNIVPFKESKSHPLARSTVEQAWRAATGGTYSEDDDAFSIQHVKLATKLDNTVDTKEGGLTNAVIDVIKKEVEPITYAQWSGVNDSYRDSKTAMVVCTELIEANENDPRGNDWIMIGHTLDALKLPCAFPVYNKTIEDAIEMSNNRVFEIDYISVTWSRRTDIFPAPANTTDMAHWAGVAVLHGRNPRPVFVN
jgi:predicted glutamine amidotransferase